jgi:hypothetical protein
MPEPISAALLIAAALAAAGSTATTLKLSEIDAWIEAERGRLNAPKGRVWATVTSERTEKGQITVTASLYCLEEPFISLSFKPKQRLVASKPWAATRLEPALERKFKGKKSFNVELTRS